MTTLGEEPTGDAGDLFGLGKPRAAGTGSLLRRSRPNGPTSPATEPAPVPAPVAPAVPAEAVDVVPPREPVVSPPPPRQAPPPDRQHRRRVVVYVSQNVADRLERCKRKAKGRTNTSVLLVALNAAAKDDLPAKVEAARIPHEDLGMFPVADSQMRYRGGGPVQLQVAMTPDQLQAFDTLVASSGVGDRTKLAALALNAFLPGRKD